jgi:GNAT superfamily N-acetyltransferase
MWDTMPNPLRQTAIVTAPLLTDRLIDRLVRIDADAMVARMSALRADTDNRYGIEIRRFGRVTAMLARHLRPLFFSRVLGLRAEEIDHVDELLAWYRSEQRACRIELVPPRTSPDLLALLHARGFAPSEFISVMYGRPQPPGPKVPGVVVVRPLEEAERALFARLHLQGSEYGGSRWAEVEHLVTMEHASPGWRCYVGVIDGTPAGVGALFMQEGTSYLGGAATLPAWRGQGCQAALVQRRVEDAAATCDLVMSQTSPGSASQRNLQRLGFQLAYTTVVWSPQPT